MKKQTIKTLKLNKTTISKLESKSIVGGGWLEELIERILPGGGSAGICTGEDPVAGTEFRD